METPPFLSRLRDDLQTRFDRERTLLSFQEYLEVVERAPLTQARDAATYTRDAFDFFGTSEVQRPYGAFTRYHLFDAPFDEGVDALAGQESIQEEVYGLLNDFIREGRVNKLILLHGPNGSAKSTFISCIQRGLEHYSETEEGALYTFNWIFPSKKTEMSGIGFGSSKGVENLESFAHLAAGDIDARLPSEMRDHPLLLLPREQRVEWLTELLGRDHELPKSLIEGALSPKSAQIFESLLKTYQGDISEVYRHIQVERFTISRRYRRAISTVDPQLRADASARQITADRSLSSLPVSLQHLNLFEPLGHLVEGNRGLIEYNDLLKRPVEAFKYLLSTCEYGAVRLDHMTLFLDAVLIGSCNIDHLRAFKELPEFASFQGRIALVCVPYLLDNALEATIYAPQIKALQLRADLTPDVASLLATWAVMTRLERPQPVHYPSQMKTVIEGLTPLEKVKLYAEAKVPSHLGSDERKLLLQLIESLYYEPRVDSMYEGWLGASPREMKALLLSIGREAANVNERKSSELVALDSTSARPYVTPLHVLNALKDLCAQESLYTFLRRKPSGTYYQPKSFISTLRETYLDAFEELLHDSMGLVSPKVTLEVFHQYIEELTYVIRGEKKPNAVTGSFEDPNEHFMREVESRLNIHDERTRARGEFIQRIAKWSLENRDQSIDYEGIFYEEIKRLQESYFEELKETAQVHRRELFEFAQGVTELDEEAHTRASKTFAALLERGYGRSAALDLIQEIDRRS